MIGQFRGQFRVAREKSGERPVFNRMHRLRIEPLLRKHCNVLVAENLHVRLRPRVTKRFECGQSENEIADCAAADHQNAVHLSCVATALRAVFMMKSKQSGRPATAQRLQQSSF